MSILCYNLIVTSAGLYQKHAEIITVSAAIQQCSLLHYVDTDVTTNAGLNTSADSSVTTANLNINNIVTSATSESLVTPDVDLILNEDIISNMKITINIIIHQPTIKTIYAPLATTRKEDIVKKN